MDEPVARLPRAGPRRRRAPNEAVRAEPAAVGTGRSRDPLGLEIRLLGSLLGQVIAEQAGRDLLDLGIIPMDNMLPETAYMKLAWVLGQTDEPKKIRELMLTPVNHEITPREPHNGYLIMQGGLPEVENFTRQQWK